MRVIVNGLAALKPRTGIGCYVANLLESLDRVAGPGTVASFPAGGLRLLVRSSFNTVFKPRKPAPARPSVAAPRPGPGWRDWLRATGQGVLERAFRLSCGAGRYQVYHEPNFIPWPTELPTVVTVHDLSVLRYPQWHPRDRVAWFERHFARGLGQGRHFLAISDAAADELVRLLGIPRSRVSATHMGVRPEYRPLPPASVEVWRKRLGLPPAYLLCVGTIEPRKNVLMLLRTYCSLPSPVRDRFPLVLVGGWGWNCGDVAAYYESEAKHRNVRHLGHLPDAAMPAVYAGARALAYPTFYEGFGLPPLEMMACGGAVLAGACDAVREVLGGHAGLLDPHDTDAWRNALYRACTDHDFHQRLTDGATDRAAAYTWERCARETLRVYERVAAAA